MSEPQFLSTDPQAGLPKAPPSPAPPVAVLPDVSKHAGVPVAGRGTQFDPEQAQRAAKSAYDTATTPLAHPTGVDMIDGFTSPVGLASLVAGGAGIVRAGITGGATAAAKTALANAAPLVKYEATKTVLESLGMPSSMATVAASVVSGYKRGTKTAAAEVAPTVAAEAAPAAVAGSTLSAADEAALYKQGYSPATVEKIKAAARQQTAVPSASPVASPPAAATVPASPVPSTAAQSPTVEAPPSAPAPSPQQMLNEEALARRRAAYQASQAAPVAAPAKPFLLSSESPEYMRLIKAGKTHQQAMDVIEANRALRERLGLSTPTAAETRFPKGMRGKVDPE